MNVVLDTDVLIKMTKISLKETLTSSFSVVLPPEVVVESVDQGKQGGHPRCAEGGGEHQAWTNPGVQTAEAWTC